MTMMDPAPARGTRPLGQQLKALIRRLWWQLRRPPLEKLIRKIAVHGRKGAGPVAVGKLSQRQLGELMRRDAGRSLATLHRALRELRRVDEDLLAAFEQKLGVRRPLELVLKAGTLVELFQLARYSTPPTAKRLISLLSEEDVERLKRRTATSEHSIGMLGATLKALERTHEHLTATLEEKLEERLFLDLILGSGTIFELLRFLSYPRPEAARRLVAALTAADIERLLAQTAASRRSFWVLELALRRLAQTDEQLTAAVVEKIGAYRWWRLILARGSLSVVTGVARYASRDFEQQLFTVLAAAPTTELETLLRRGDLFRFCRLLRWRSAQMASVVSRQLFDRLRPALDQMLDRADWHTRARAAYQLAHAPPLPLMRAMTALVYDRLERVEPRVSDGGPLDGRQDPDVLRVLLHCARHLVCADPSLASRGVILVERHLGPPDGWSQTPGFVRWGRDLLRMACEPELDDEATVDEWLHAACRPEVAPLLAEAATLDVFLYLWNLYALWFQRREEAGGDFREIVSGPLRAEALRAFSDRSSSEEGEEPRTLLALGGLLSFAGLMTEADLAVHDPQVWPDPEHLASMLDGSTFVPSALAVLGYEAVLGRRCGEALRRDVAERLDDYPAPTAVMRFLQLWTRR